MKDDPKTDNDLCVLEKFDTSFALSAFTDVVFSHILLICSYNNKTNHPTSSNKYLSSTVNIHVAIHSASKEGDPKPTGTSYDLDKV